MRQFFNFFVTSNVFIALCASLLYLYYGLKLKHNFFLTTPLLVFGGTYLSYHLVRLGPWLRGSNSSDFFPIWYKKHKYFTAFSLIIAALLALFSIKDTSTFQLTLLFLSLLIVLLYEVGLSTVFHLRKLPYIKPFIISISWGLICVGLHFKELNENFIFNFIDCFILIFLLCLPFDMKDKSDDNIQGIKSLPNLIEEKFLAPILVTFFGSYLWLSINLLSPEKPNGTLPVIFTLYTYVQISFFYKKKLPPLAIYLSIDGIIILKSWSVF